MDKPAKSTELDELFDSDIMMFMMMIMMMLIMSSFISGSGTGVASTAALTAQGLAPQSRVLKAQGRMDPRSVHATEELQWLDLIHELPGTPWVHAYIVNNGPCPVEIGINYPNDRFTINPGGSIELDYANMWEGISILYYTCMPAWVPFEAYVEITGEY